MAGTLFENNLSPYLTIVEATEPAAPAAGQQRLYIDSTSHKLKATNSSGTERDIEGISDPTSNRGEIIRRGAAALEALSAKTAGKVLVGDGTDVVSAYPPGYEFDYAEITSPVNITATVEASATTIITGNAVTYDGSTIVVIECFVPYIQAPGNDTNTSLWLYDGSSSIGRLTLMSNQTATGVSGSFRIPTVARRRLTPSNAAHTYSIRGTVNAGTGIANAGAGGSGASMPAYIRITKV